MQSKTKSLILVVDENNLSQVESIESGTFTDLKIWERSHIQEWIIKSPEILGEELLVLSVEFDRFIKSSDRLDILAMDRKGNLVIIELKRDSMAGYADLQSLRYAAMISGLTIEKILPYFIAYHNKNHFEEPLDEQKAKELILDYIDAEFENFSQKPRIILCSENFSTELTTTVLWLRDQFKVDISCVRIKPHKIGSKIIVVPTMIIPIPEAKQYQTEIQEKEEAIYSDQSSRTKRPASVRLLLENGYLKTGDIIKLQKSKLPQHLQPFFDGKKETYYQAEITGKSGKTNNFKWLNDQKEYSISNLTHHIFVDIHPEHQHPGAIAGPDYWSLDDKISLYELANEIWNKNKTNGLNN